MSYFFHHSRKSYYSRLSIPRKLLPLFGDPDRMLEVSATATCLRLNSSHALGKLRAGGFSKPWSDEDTR